MRILRHWLSLYCLVLALAIVPEGAQAADGTRLYGIDVVQAMEPCLRDGLPSPADIAIVPGDGGGAGIHWAGGPWFAVFDLAHIGADWPSGYLLYLGAFAPDVQREPLVLMYRYTNGSLHETLEPGSAYWTAVGCFDAVYPMR